MGLLIRRDPHSFFLEALVDLNQIQAVAKLFVDKDTCIYGVGRAYHDTAYCLVRDHKLIDHVFELERITRVKEDSTDPFFLLKSFLKTEFRAQTHTCKSVYCWYAEDSFFEFLRAYNDSIRLGEMPEQAIAVNKRFYSKYHYDDEILPIDGSLHPDRFADQKNRDDYQLLAIEKVISEILEDRALLWIVGHHEAHSSIAHYTNSSTNSLIITIDGGGIDFNPSNVTQLRRTCCSIGVGDHESHSIISCDDLDIGGNWSSMLKLLGYQTGPPFGNQAGTLMAMAALGDPSKFYHELRQDWLWSHKATHAGARDVFYENYKHKLLSDKNLQFDLCAALQLCTEHVLFDKIRTSIETYSKLSGQAHVNLCISGGSALNCSALGKIHQHFSDAITTLHSPFLPYDGGLGVGSCLKFLHNVLGVKFGSTRYTPYLGNSYNVYEVKSALSKYVEDICYCTISDADVFDFISKGSVVALYQGRSECGRRALGNRSIVADPRIEGIKDQINMKVKHRQNFRPFAPAVLASHYNQIFHKNYDSPYMQLAVKFKDDYKLQYASVVHADGTGRVQVVNKENSPLFYTFLKGYYLSHGSPILLNTSFNDREPIVETPTDAIHTFLQTNIDYLYFRDYHIFVSKKL